MRAGFRNRLILLALFVALAAAGAAALPRSVSSEPEPVRAEARTATTRPTCQPASLQDRAAHVLVVGIPDVTDPSDPLVDEVLGLGVGGVLLTDGNVESHGQVAALVQDLRRRSRHPLVVSTDEETGRVRTFEDVLGRTPSARRLAKESTPPAVRQRGRELGAALASMGIDLDLAPVADLDAGPYSGIIGDRSFSADPTVATQYALAFAAGLTDGGVRATAKHFPGHGSAHGDDHSGRITSSISLSDLDATHVKPFVAMVGAGIPVVMMSNVDYAALDRDLPASLSPAAYRLLRETGFRGVALTDSVGMGAVNLRWDPGTAAVKAIEAGADGVLVTNGSFAREMVDSLAVAVQRGELSEARLNEAAARMAALAGGDPIAVACQAAVVPRLTTTAGAGG
ncbi:MAG TPA: glycoside hydrolase family 3 N-terminal domain-containing protein [Acidimicrobiales bacterium]|nr:glycoside hydrolase family 3 N-terminal domain-containing protein [Acidimicrobiales bacterium]